MGVMSRRVIPACGNLCFFCPSLRARSRQPVKRYKKLLSDIFPRNQEAEPNDRKIGKLCEYASKNPLRIPKITETLEQRFYKELRHGRFGSVKVVACIYRKMLFSCKDQMSLFASSLLGIMQTLLEQTQRVELQTLACNSFGDFISSQVDGSYMFNLEGIIPKLCRLSEGEGDDENALRLRSAGLQALASMVSFMGEHSHISMDFDNIISVTLENYIDFEMNAENSEEDHWTQEVRKAEDNASSFPNTSKKVTFANVDTKSQLVPTGDTSKNPSYWSRACLCNMAKLAKEASTVRRILEPLFHNFDVNDRWSLQSGVACSVLMQLQSLLEETGENSHLLLSGLIKHLDHKNVAKQPLVQIDIVNIAERLGQNSKQQCTVALIGAISELLKHLRKCFQISSGSSSQKDDPDKLNLDLQSALEKCILQFSNKVGDVGPILDMMAGFLENVAHTAAVARTTISAVLRTAHIIASVPNMVYNKKAFPDALFHQLLIAMAHPDHEVRVGAHTIFSIVLIPSLVSPCSYQKNTSEAITRSFGSSTRKKTESFSIRHASDNKAESANGESSGDIQLSIVADKTSKEIQVLGHPKILKQAISDGKMVTSLRLSSHQVSLLLSSIWMQAINAENTPLNFEAMANTYHICLVFSRSKTASHIALVRCFQLAFSLRSISLDQEAGLLPSRRRSLFTLSSCMLLLSAKAGNVQELIPFVQASLKAETVDPHLELAEEVGSPNVHLALDGPKIAYGSEEDDVAALKSLSCVEANDNFLKETVTSHFMTKLSTLSEEELLDIKQQLLQGFSPDDAYPLGGPLFMETPRPCSPLSQLDTNSIEEDIAEAALTDDETLTEANGSQSDRKTSLSNNTVDIIGVNQLLDSVLKTAQQVASSQVSYTPLPYDEMMSQCEALVSEKQQKMSMLHSFKHQHDTRIFPSEDEPTSNADLDRLSQSSHHSDDSDQSHASNQLVVSSSISSLGCGQNSFRLPPSSPYDKFLKAAGC
ncbi:unnamed protein product [Linum trigynum]|uniref:ARM repeat superfamily protein n=1 Tax=Linum trigynum TaxID=586398 RepID=A0AAV2D3G7_9ROSI